MSIFYRFRDVTIYWSKNLCFFAIFIHRSLVRSPCKRGSSGPMPRKLVVDHRQPTFVA